MLPVTTRWRIFFFLKQMADSAPLEAVLFRIGDLLCAAPTGLVREILPRLPATRIPGVSEVVEGLVNVRGTLLTVVDGHGLLAREPLPADEGGIVLVELAGRRFGLAVGQVLDFVEVAAGDVAERQELPGIDPRLVRAVAVKDGRAFILLDIEALLAPVLGG